MIIIQSQRILKIEPERQQHRCSLFVWRIYFVSSTEVLKTSINSFRLLKRFLHTFRRWYVLFYGPISTSLDSIIH